MFQIMAWFTYFIRKLLRHSTALDIQPFNGRNSSTVLNHPIRLVLQCKRYEVSITGNYEVEQKPRGTRNVWRRYQDAARQIYVRGCDKPPTRLATEKWDKKDGSNGYTTVILLSGALSLRKSTVPPGLCHFGWRLWLRELYWANLRKYIMNE